MDFGDRDPGRILIGYDVQRTAGRCATASVFLVQIFTQYDPLRGKECIKEAQDKAQA
jgi:hypothetical protein